MKIQKININNIIPDKDQPRKSFEEIDDLLKSILKEGLIEPLKVMKKEDGSYILLDGERRYRAIERLYNSTSDKGFLEINCIIMNPKNKSILQLMTDVQKHKLNHVEEGEAYKKLMEEDGFDIKDISVMIGKKTNYVRNKLKLTAFNEETKRLIVEKKIPAQLLYGLDIVKFKDAEDEIINRINKEKPVRGDVRRIVLQEIERYGALVNHFLIDLDKLNRKFKDFDRRSYKIKKIDIEKKVGLQVFNAIKQIDEFSRTINRIEDLKNETKKTKNILENIQNKYGKGTIITDELVR